MKEREKKFFKLCDELGVTKVSKDLGYSSKHTIYHWKNNERIPPLAWEAVDDYLKKNRPSAKKPRA